ncbi:Long-chain fatty acid transport protein [Flexibacter flexilis DSM 6793]|uniref:Long-chain fatty acid transport protein n=2 Tax=Flexibacter flexilis TaxID=998 RepID=A0A1I1KEY9_9BACT|nr:Long-chain fatty acid transport protein [Flexibacter flexilis DSM 6793]
MALNCWLAYGALAQNTTGHSPYSRFGLGDLSSQGGSRAMGMAETGVAAPSDENINLLNPALLTYNRVTNFQIDLYGQRKKMSTSSASETSTGGGLTNLAFSFPITKKMTAAFGLSPYSSVDYWLNTTTVMNTATDTASAIYAYKGSGSLSKVFLATGYAITPNLSVGVQANYLFGTLTNESVVQILPASDNNSFSVNKRDYYSRILFKPGVFYKAIIDTASRKYIGIGATIELGSSGNLRYDNKIYEYDGQGGTVEIDERSINQKTNFTMPATYRVGLGMGVPLKWKLAADFSYTDWTKLKNNNTTSNSAMNAAYMAAVGGEWIPGYHKAGYWNKVTYRAGLNFQQTPITVNGQKINDMYVGLGMGLPIFRKETKFMYPMVNLGLAVGQRGTTQNSGIKENYFRISLGFVLNDNLWFTRYKID